MNTSTLRLYLVAAALACLSGCAVTEQALGPRLQPAGFVSRPDLATVVSVQVSTDNRYLYSAAYNTASLAVFQRDIKTGQLTHIQTLSDSNLFNGATSIQLSADGRYAVSTAFRSGTVTLLQRDPPTGRLTVLDTARQGVDGVNGLNFVIQAAFSPDSRFVYAIADASAAVSVFRLTEAKRLELIQTERGELGCFQGARGLALSGDGRSIYVASSRARCIVFLERDLQSGRITLKQVMRDGVDAIRGLAGVFWVTCSADGRHLYGSAGRFGGTNAVTLFERRQDGSLAFVEALFGGEGGIKDFAGGNKLVVTQDGTAVYALGTVSGSIACFRRDARTGKLTHFETILSKEGGAGPLGLVSGIGLSADGRYVYTAAERDGAISIFRRVSGPLPAAPTTKAAPATQPSIPSSETAAKSPAPQEADPALSKALGDLESAERTYGKEHPLTVAAQTKLAFLYAAQRQYDKAEPLYLRALEIREKILGTENSALIPELTNLAELYRAKGDANKAEAYRRRAAAVREKSRPPRP